MSFHFVDTSTYPRSEHFNHFLELNLTYSATVSIDISQLRKSLKENGLKAYPAQIWLLTTAANHVPEFRMSLDDEHRLLQWDSLSPIYTVLSEQARSFSGIWTAYKPKFGGFYRACLEDIERFNNGSFQPQTDMPGNALNVSSIPWLDFTAFNLNLPTKYLLPILTIGKYDERDGKTYMPLSVQVHHAVCDGYHLGLFVAEVRRLAASVDEWLKA